jgi:hypothetical protein
MRDLGERTTMPHVKSFSRASQRFPVIQSKLDTTSFLGREWFICVRVGLAGAATIVNLPDASSMVAAVDVVECAEARGTLGPLVGMAEEGYV